MRIFGILFLSFFLLLSKPTFGNLVTLDVGEIVLDDVGGTNSSSSNLEFDLEEMESRSIILQIYAESPFPEEEMDHFITVLASEDHSLLGFVTSAHLRVIWINESTITNDASSDDQDGEPNFFPECLDYISVDGPGGLEKICHDVSRNDSRFHPPTLVGPRNFRRGLGEREMKLHIHTAPFTNNNATRRRLLAEIVLTAYAECPEEVSQESDEGMGSGMALSRCSFEEDFSCIPFNLFCDSEVHCLFPDAYGQDEKNCGVVEDEDPSTTETGEEISPSWNGTMMTTGSTSRERWNRRHHGRIKNRNNNNKGDVVVVVNEETKESGESHAIRNYFVPTAAFLFIIWGLVTLFRKCYRCYRNEYGKEDQFYS